MTGAEQLSFGNVPDQAQLDALAPLNIIRTETVLSKLPVHNLAKKGKVDIRILRRSVEGEVHLKWEVSHNDRYGQPRQLAYKLDTLIVNKRIDDSERPLPQLIRIGSLKEVCRCLGVQESGKNLRDVRVAFLQNASVFINAQFTYRGADGTEKRLEAGFTRYGVIFTGEKLPDGREADAVYISLNAPYWEVVNSAPFRPLNYDYLRELRPGAQRFYEVISFRMFAALRHERPVARIAYSDYCAFSAQRRHYDHENFRVQMYKIHKPHLQSGYIKNFEHEPAIDVEGKPDWLLSYVPGPKARVEYQTFTKKQRSHALVPVQATLEEEPLALVSQPRQSAKEFKNFESEELRALVDRGVTEARARMLLNSLSKEQAVLDQVEWGDFLLRQARKGTFHNPPGFYFSLIRDNVLPPATFETSRQAKLRQQAEKAHQERYAEEARLQMLYEQYSEAETEQAFRGLPAEQVKERAALKRKEYARKFPTLLAQTLDEIALQGVKRELAESLILLSFKEFSHSHASRKLD